MSLFTATSTGHVALNLIEPDAIGIRVLRDGEPFQMFAATIPGPDRIHLHGLDPHVEATRERLWRSVLAAGAELLPEVVARGLADHRLPRRQPLVAVELDVPLQRDRYLCEHARVLPELNHARVATFEVDPWGALPQPVPTTNDRSDDRRSASAGSLSSR